MDDKTNKILVYTVLDRSGSMQGTAAETRTGYNEYLAKLREDKDSEYTISLTQFDKHVQDCELTVTCEDKPIADAPNLTTDNYQPRGYTPLYDAIGECIRRVDAKDRAVIMLIITDGHENASIEFTKEKVQALIKEKEAAGWTFSFLGANIDSFAVGASVGVAAGNVSNYVQGHEKTMYTNLANATMGRAASVRSVGMNAAVGMRFFSEEQQHSIGNPQKLGGRPPAPPTFHPPAPVTPKRRDWKISG